MEEGVIADTHTAMATDMYVYTKWSCKCMLSMFVCLVRTIGVYCLAYFHDMYPIIICIKSTESVNVG